MKATRIWLAMALVPLAAACGGGDAGEGAAAGDTAMAGAATAPATTDTAAMTMPADTTHTAMGGNKVVLQQVGTSGVGGEATFSAQGQSTMVMVTLTNAPQGPHSGHIHQGTCDAPGQVVAPLQDITIPAANGTGSSHSTVEVPLSAVMNGQHIVAYHTGAGESAGAPIVCGAIPAEQAAAGGAATTDTAAKM